MEQYMQGIAKLRLSPREMIPGRYVSKTFSKDDMVKIRKELDHKTETAFNDFDEAKRRTYTDIYNTVFD